MCNTFIVVKTAVLFDYIIVKMTPDNRHFSRDPEISSVTRNCELYSLQLNTLKMGILNLKNSWILS